ncbi:hypothetical protein ACYU3O_001448 [Campylobacter upsaliensis]
MNLRQSKANDLGEVVPLGFCFKRGAFSQLIARLRTLSLEKLL